jgi:hypothetical protein
MARAGPQFTCFTGTKKKSTNADAAAARRQAYDVVITSDTAPISRVFLEAQRWEDKSLIVWVCNRFDYSHRPAAHGFPDATFYRLMQVA